jgi:hypothetical protein
MQEKTGRKKMWGPQKCFPFHWKIEEICEKIEKKGIIIEEQGSSRNP